MGLPLPVSARMAASLRGTGKKVGRRKQQLLGGCCFAAIASWELMPAFYEGLLLIIHIIIINYYYYVCMNIVCVPVGMHVYVQMPMHVHMNVHEC